MLMLHFLSCMAKTTIFDSMVSFFASVYAKLNLAMSRKVQLHTPEKLAEQWIKFMFIDRKDCGFIMQSCDGFTTITEIHIHCPLRNSGNLKACCNLMNYDRTLLECRWATNCFRVSSNIWCKILQTCYKRNRSRY